MKCIYLGFNPNGFYNQGTYGCSCKSHLGYSHENSWTLFGLWGGVPYHVKMVGTDVRHFNNN